MGQILDVIDEDIDIAAVPVMMPQREDSAAAPAPFIARQARRIEARRRPTDQCPPGVHRLS